MCCCIYFQIISTNRFTVIPGLGFSVLRIDVIRSERDEGRYECLTQNSGGKQTASAKLLVYPGKCLLILNLYFGERLLLLTHHLSTNPPEEKEIIGQCGRKRKKGDDERMGIG